MKRCAWAEADLLLMTYHDEEWGHPHTTDIELFELLILELFQTGLSWRTVLHKREAFRKAFKGFDLHKVAAFGDDEVEELVQDPAIIRHRGKIKAAIYNAEACLTIIKDYGSLYSFFKDLPEDIKAQQKRMKKIFKHVGPSVIESFLIAAGFSEVPHDPGCLMADNTKYETQFAEDLKK